MKRVADWDARLNQVIEQTQGFVWAQNDCCQFAARCVEAMTGRNFAAEFNYSDQAGALRYIRNNGGLTNLITNILGEPIAVNNIQRGDVVEIEQNGKSLVGICGGLKSAFVTISGLTWFDTADCVRGWSV